MRLTAPYRKPCVHCQSLPASWPEAGNLILGPPLDQTRTLLRDYLRAEGVPCTEPSPGMLTMPVTRGLLRQLGEGLPAVLSPAQLQEIKALVVEYGVTPSMTDLMHMRPLTALVATVRGEWLVTALREDRLITHFQPVVCARRPTEVFAYECLLRGQDDNGELIDPARLFEAARSLDLLLHLDRVARLTAIRSVVRHGMTSLAFINFNPSSIYNPVACLHSTVQAVEQTGIPPSRFVFEVVESEEFKDTDRLLEILDYYRKAGFKVALDDVGSGYSSLNLLTRLHPDFIKLDMQLIRGVDKDAYKAQVAGKLLEMARGLGVRTVVEGVETVDEWRWAVDSGADYAQGYVFARPSCPPPRPRFTPQ